MIKSRIGTSGTLERLYGLSKRSFSPLRRNFHGSRQVNFEFGALVTSIVEPTHSALAYLQYSSGIPWYIFVPGSTFAIRALTTLPLSVKNRKRAQKQNKLQPLLGATGPILRGKLAAHSQATNGSSSSSSKSPLTIEQIHVLAEKEKRRRRVQLFKQNKCQVWKSIIVVPSVQIPIFIALSLTIRAMCGWSLVDGIPIEEGFKTESFLWIKDLLVPDPSSFLPITIGALSLLNVEWNVLNTLNSAASQSKLSTSSSGNAIAGAITNILRMGSLSLTIIALNAPSILCLYWASSNLFSLVQNIILDKYLPLRYIPPKLGRGQVLKLEENIGQSDTTEDENNNDKTIERKE